MSENRGRSRGDPLIEDAHRFPEDSTRKRRPPPPDQDVRRRKAQQRKRRRSVFRYIGVLFMAAFILLLYTFMMERRQSQQQIDDLKQSASAVQTLQGLMEENAALKAQVQNLEKEVELQKETAQELELLYDGLTDSYSNLENVHTWTTEAMDYFWQINEAYVRGKTTLCKQLITAMESASGQLVENLPKENTTGTDRFSPYDRYMEIRGKVIK